MALYHKWDVKNGFAYVLTFFSLISDGLGSVLFIGNGELCTAEINPSEFDVTFNDLPSQT